MPLRGWIVVMLLLSVALFTEVHVTRSYLWMGGGSRSAGVVQADGPETKSMTNTTGNEAMTNIPKTDWPQDGLPVSARPANTNRKVFIDLGANCGNTYLKRKEQMDEEGGWEVFLWEPSPQMHTFFLDELATNNPGIRILPYAAGAVDSELQLYIHKGQEHAQDKSQFRDGGRCDPRSPYNPSGGSTLFRSAKVAGKPVTVRQLNFPQWLQQLQLQPNDKFILKVDIEGSELEIMEQLLSMDHKDRSICVAHVIEMEFHKNIFDEGTPEYTQHETFEDNFSQRYEDKCGRKPNLTKLS